MPALSRWFIRTALLELLAGFCIGAAMLATRGPALAPWTAAWLPLHVELLVFGWLANLTLGVAHWMLPKHASGPERGHPAPVALAWALLNGGVLLAGARLAPVAGRSAELAGVLLFVSQAWPRVKAFGAGRGMG